MKILLFGGTAEGHVLARRLAEAGHQVICCVATEYGRDVLEPQRGLTVRKGPMAPDTMTELMRNCDSVVDATHPYATHISESIRQAAARAGVPCQRLVRPPEAAEDVLWADSPLHAAQLLAELPGNVLLTTGSKDLAIFTQVPGYAERIWARVLPSLESLRTALELGFPASHVICMQGPFSQEMNTAMLRTISGNILVTKDTGRPGGFGEKAAAAREAGARLLVIRRPVEETGLTLEELLDQWTGGNV